MELEGALTYPHVVEEHLKEGLSLGKVVDPLSSYYKQVVT